MKTRVYAIKECEDVHEISNEDFINQAEDLGYSWSLLDFQNLLNVEGHQPKCDNDVISKLFYLYFRFIDVEVS